MNRKSAEESTAGIIEALQEFSKRSSTFVTDVRLVILQKEVLDIYHKILKVSGGGAGKNQLCSFAILLERIVNILRKQDTNTS